MGMRMVGMVLLVVIIVLGVLYLGKFSDPTTIRRFMPTGGAGVNLMPWLK